MYTPVDSVLQYKVGCKGVYITRTYVFKMENNKLHLIVKSLQNVNS